MWQSGFSSVKLCSQLSRDNLRLPSNLILPIMVNPQPSMIQLQLKTSIQGTQYSGVCNLQPAQPEPTPQVPSPQQSTLQPVSGDTQTIPPPLSHPPRNNTTSCHFFGPSYYMPQLSPRPQVEPPQQLETQADISNRQDREGVAESSSTGRTRSVMDEKAKAIQKVEKREKERIKKAKQRARKRERRAQ